MSERVTISGPAPGSLWLWINHQPSITESLHIFRDYYYNYYCESSQQNFNIWQHLKCVQSAVTLQFWILVKPGVLLLIFTGLDAILNKQQRSGGLGGQRHCLNSWLSLSETFNGSWTCDCWQRGRPKKTHESRVMRAARERMCHACYSIIQVLNSCGSMTPGIVKNLNIFI